MADHNVKGVGSQARLIDWDSISLDDTETEIGRGPVAGYFRRALELCEADKVWRKESLQPIIDAIKMHLQKLE